MPIAWGEKLEKKVKLIVLLRKRRKREVIERILKHKPEDSIMPDTSKKINSVSAESRMISNCV